MSRKTLRPCSVPGCPNLSTEGRCATHRASKRAAEDARRGTRTERGLDNTWLRLRDRAVRDHVAEHGWACPGFNRPPHPVRPGGLTGDHIVPRSVAPDRAHDPTNIAVLCGPCNSAKGSSAADQAAAPPPRREYRAGSPAIR